MIITSSNVSMGSQRNFQRNIKQQTTITRWQDATPSNITTSTHYYSYNYKEETVYNNYNDFAQNFKNVRQNSTSTQSSIAASVSRMPHQEGYELFEESVSKTLRSLLDMLLRAKGLTSDRHQDYDYYGQSFNTFVGNSSTISFNTDNFNIWNQITDTSYHYEEMECTSFASTGTAITADGREITFNVSFTMSRAFKEEYQTSAFTQYEQVLTDPLVINLDSNPTTVSDQTFFFDIDCDGKEDELSSLSEGNGFLAYDKNNDGIINDGNELFGTKSGNGFYDLSQYDKDQNGWIDEADDIFRHLKVWTKDKDGNDRLISLKEADVGAIYLGSTSTQFSLKDQHNNLNALIRSSGIFLKENGQSGCISQIDLAKHQEV